MSIAERIKALDDRKKVALSSEQAQQLEQVKKLERIAEQDRLFNEKLQVKLLDLRKMADDSKLEEIMADFTKTVPGFSYHFVAKVPFRKNNNAGDRWDEITVGVFDENSKAISIPTPEQSYQDECLKGIVVSCIGKWENSLGYEVSIVSKLISNSLWTFTAIPKIIIVQDKRLSEKDWKNKDLLEEVLFSAYLEQNKYSPNSPRNDNDWGPSGNPGSWRP